MRKLLTLVLTVFAVTSLTAQSASRVMTKQEAAAQFKETHKVSMQQQHNAEFTQNASRTSTTTNTPPVGTGINSNSVNAIKIGEASNAFTYLILETNQLATYPGAGTGGGSLAFIYRQNINQCGGMVLDNGRYRYSISTDGGATWDVGAATVPPTFSGCFGKGTINPTYTRASRYPNATLFSRSNSSDTDSLGIVYVGPVLQTSGSGWDGLVRGTVVDVTSATPVVTQEEYFGQAPNSSEYFAFALVEQPDSLNFWYLSRDWDGANIGNQLILNKGSYNPATRQVDWNVVQTFTFNHFVLDGDVITPISPQLAFGPDGTVAYIGFLGDLAGGLDSVISPVLIESTDGGNTWGAPEEFDMSVFPEVYDSLAFYSLVLDSVFDMSGNFVRVDTVPFITHPTCAFDCDLEVDANGDPHLLAVVGGGASLNAPPAYSIFTFDYNLYDFTKDRFGDPNMLYVNDINTFRGYFGDITGTTSDYFAVDPYTQVSRSDDGNFIFYSWTDTDTTAPGYGPTPGPGTATQTNNAPDMYGRGLNVTAQKMTPTVDWTLTDTVWVGRAVMPKTANIAVRNGSVLTVPSIIINLNGASAIDAVSFWYFSNVNYDTDTDFIEDPVYFYNCKENPFTATNTTLTVVDAACGTGNGSATLATTGGIGPYTYAWSNGDQTPAITGQGAGVYTVTVTDSKGCTDVQTAVINNAGSAALTLNATASPSCFGLTDGSATVGVAGGTAPITYLWSNGETTASATQLPGGTSTLEATDANGCKSFLNVTLTPPSQITGLVAGTDILCNGDGNGTASVVSVSGGAGGYTYSWSNGANTQNITGLAGGTYTVTITDGNNCENDISIDVIEPDSISLQGSATDVTDCTFPDGTGSAAATGGTPPYTFNWSGPNGYTNSGTFVFGLDTGIYTIEVIDDNGCASTSTVTVAGCGFAIGIEDALNAGINTVDLYPNPNSGNFTLNVEMAEVSDLNITVLNVTGKQVYSLNASQVLNFKEGINIGNQPAGIYLLRLSTDKGATTMKFNLR